MEAADYDNGDDVPDDNDVCHDIDLMHLAIPSSMLRNGIINKECTEAHASENCIFFNFSLPRENLGHDFLQIPFLKTHFKFHFLFRRSGFLSGFLRSGFPQKST